MSTPWNKLTDEAFRSWLLEGMSEDEFNESRPAERRQLLATFQHVQNERELEKKNQAAWEYIQEQKEESNTVKFSRVPSAVYRRIMADIQLKLSGATWAVRPTNLTGVEPFTWSAAKEDSEENRDAYMQYLRENIAWPEGYGIVDCRDNTDLLSVPSLGGTPRKTSGNIDVVLALEADVLASALRHNIRLGIELKKSNNTGSHEHQVVLQHVCASSLNFDQSVLTVMTDLNERWHFYWFGTQPRTLYKILVSRSEAKYLVEHMFDDPATAEATSFPTDFLSRAPWTVFQANGLSTIQEKPSHDHDDEDESGGRRDLGHPGKGGSKRPSSDGNHNPLDKKGKNQGGLSRDHQAKEAYDSIDVANELDLLDFVDDEVKREIALRNACNHILPWLVGSACRDLDEPEGDESSGLSAADLAIHNAKFN
mmetsp:Transcript_43579/g.105673  ORF Transcript_43579/g.105673 Transcript_43579/m.105673 type:complete len:424 (+) Transcript_43579:245-1516(+)